MSFISIDSYVGVSFSYHGYWINTITIVLDLMHDRNRFPFPELYLEERGHMHIVVKIVNAI